jgi:hypothetical protein
MSAAWFARDFFAPLVPDPHELVSNIWAGFLAAIGAVHLQQIVLLRRKPRDLLVRSFREIPFGLRSYAFAYAVDSHIDPRIPLAIMTAENLERPRWVRRFERLLPRRLSLDPPTDLGVAGEFRRSAVPLLETRGNCRSARPFH